MVLELRDVLVPFVVSLVIVPLVSYLWGRRSAQAQGAADARRSLYEELFRALVDYRDHVHWMPPNMRGGGNSPKNEQVISDDLSFAMRLHASPVMLAHVKELMTALDESKGQSWHRVEMQRQMELHTGKDKRNHFAGLMFEHDRLKLANDKWADACVTRIRHRIRWELYGWRPASWYLRLRLRPSVKRIAAGRTNFFTGGVDRTPPA